MKRISILQYNRLKFQLHEFSRRFVKYLLDFLLNYFKEYFKEKIFQGIFLDAWNMHCILS